jgi:hypothetical protein
MVETHFGTADDFGCQGCRHGLGHRMAFGRLYRRGADLADVEAVTGRMIT